MSTTLLGHLRTKHHGERDSIENVDNEEFEWEHATLRYTVSGDLFPSLVLQGLYLSLPVFKVFHEPHEYCVD